MVTIDPAYVSPGEVWLVAPPGGRAGVWVGMRPGLDNGVWWRLVRVGGDGIVYLRDDDVRLLDQLVPASREAAERDRDLLRRAHSIVERERDEARAERDEAVDRAEAAEARTAPAVTKRELRSVVAAHDPGDDELAVSRVNALTDRLWSLVSGADPAVHVVRESEVAAVEVRRASDGWYADGAWLASADETAEWVRDRAAEMVVCAARNEAVARAIEAEEAEAVDPVEELAGQIESATREAIRQVCDDLADVVPSLDPLAVERAMEVTSASRKVAAHVLGQEVK